jgi:hypothetical protein
VPGGRSVPVLRTAFHHGSTGHRLSVVDGFGRRTGPFAGEPVGSTPLIEYVGSERGRRWALGSPNGPMVEVILFAVIQCRRSAPERGDDEEGKHLFCDSLTERRVPANARRAIGVRGTPPWIGFAALRRLYARWTSSRLANASLRGCRSALV